jgi:hypothetical protein
MKKKPSKSKKSPAVKDDGSTGQALYGLTKELGSILADELHPLYHLEEMAQSVNDVAVAMDTLARATAMSVIAKNGSEEDRAKAVSFLKNWFEDFRE